MKVKLPANVKTYLGDGLFAEFDGYQIWLRAHREDMVHEVALEPAVFDALVYYAGKVWSSGGDDDKQTNAPGDSSGE